MIEDDFFERMIELGRRVDEAYEPGFMIDGRPITNVEMMASTLYRSKQTRALVAQFGCCNPDGPDDRPGWVGMCRVEPGMCPLYLQCLELIDG